MDANARERREGRRGRRGQGDGTDGTGPLQDQDLRDLAGQMVMAGFGGTTVTPELRELVVEHRIGGVILFRRNVEGPRQVAALVDGLREAAAGVGRTSGRGRRRHGALPPPAVAVDQEGGKVVRLTEPFTVFPDMARLGEVGDEARAHQVGRVLGTELAAVGITWNFAPVADVNTNPANPIIGRRALSTDPERAARLATALCLGLQSRGVAACAKHFPGHGDADQDSHQTLPVIRHDLDRLRRVELVPFARLAAARVASMMTAHILFPALDPDLPATLSPRVLRQLLREELGYNGVVVTDDLEMEAVAGRWPIEEAVRRGLQAGCDLFLVCHTPDLQVRAVEELVRLVEAGDVPKERLVASVRRIVRLKSAFPALPRDLRPGLETIGCEAHRRVAEALVTGRSPD